MSGWLSRVSFTWILVGYHIFDGLYTFCESAYLNVGVHFDRLICVSHSFGLHTFHVTVLFWIEWTLQSILATAFKRGVHLLLVSFQHHHLSRNMGFFHFLLLSQERKFKLYPFTDTMPSVIIIFKSYGTLTMCVRKSPPFFLTKDECRKVFPLSWYWN